MTDTPLLTSQQMKAKRLTRTMRELLLWAPGEIPDGGAHIRSARILARRGFLTIRKAADGWHTIELTEAGREAVARILARIAQAARRKAPCADCGIDTLQSGHDFYMVHDHLWRMAWPTAGDSKIAEPPLADAPVDAGGQYDFGFERCAEPLHEILCMRCLELRLGRALTAADFTDAPINDGIREWKGDAPAPA